MQESTDQFQRGWRIDRLAGDCYVYGKNIFSVRYHKDATNSVLSQDGDCLQSGHKRICWITDIDTFSF